MKDFFGYRVAIEMLIDKELYEEYRPISDEVLYADIIQSVYFAAILQSPFSGLTNVLSLSMIS